MRGSLFASAFLLVVSVAVIAPTLGCGAASSEAQQRREYQTRGTVRSIDLGNRTITIAHEDVPDYMPAMTMPFELTDVSQAEGISAGDRVSFRFRPEAGGRHVIVSLTKL